MNRVLLYIHYPECFLTLTLFKPREIQRFTQGNVRSIWSPVVTSDMGNLENETKLNMNKTLN